MNRIVDVFNEFACQVSITVNELEAGHRRAAIIKKTQNFGLKKVAQSLKTTTAIIRNCDANVLTLLTLL